MDTTTGTLIVALFGFGWFAMLIWLMAISFKVRRINKREQAVAKASENADFVSTVESSLREVADLRKTIEGLQVNHDEMAGALRGAVQRVGVVRFDAFEDIGGMLSFAVALLDHHGDGVLVSTINGRQESRSYAKPVVKGESKFNLSMEERQAIEEALLTPNIGKRVHSRVAGKA